MYVLFIVLNNPHKANGVLNVMREQGVKGATIMDSIGSGRYSQEHGESSGPKIGGSLFGSLNSDIVRNKTIFSVIENKELVKKVMDAVEQELGGDMEKPGTGIMFSMPLDMVRGGKISYDINNKI